MSYTQLKNQMRSVIASLPSGEKFFLKDILPNPPIRLGRTLYEMVQSGEIPNVRQIAIIDGIEQYEKL